MPQFRNTRQNHPSTPSKTTSSVVHKIVREVPKSNSVKQKNFRPIERKEPPTDPAYIEAVIEHKLQTITTPKQNKILDYYLGFGGVGDAMLLLATCWNNPNGHTMFFGNNSSIPLIRDFFRVFNVSATVMPNIMGKPTAGIIFDKLKKMATFRQSAHLADGLYYEDWRNEAKYIKRIVNHIPEWRSKFGLEYNNTVVIAPSGSSRDPARQRYLTKPEYEALVRKKLAEGYEVYGIGSDRDWREYQMREKGVWWVTNRILRDWEGKSKSHNLTDMLKIINSAAEAISMDTWLKTYTMIAGIPTTVVATRWHGNYKVYGTEAADWIFLNKKIWPNLKVIRIEDLLL